MVGTKAKDLLEYTFTVTKPISDKGMGKGEVVALLRQMSNLHPQDTQRMAVETAETLSRNTQKQGFPKSALHTYVKAMQETALRIMGNVHAANECSFQTEYDRRLSLINQVLDDCNLILKLVEISHKLGYINQGRMEHWGKHITDVKFMTLAWRKKDTERAEQMRKQKREAEMNHQANVIGEAVYRAIMEAKRPTQ